MTAALASMTGFARSEGSLPDLAWAWELRSVNGRGLDLKFRLPGFDAMEPGLREQAAAVLRRGNVAATCTLRRDSGSSLVADATALDQVVALARGLQSRLPTAALSIDGLLALPGVLRVAQAETALTDAHCAVLRDGFASALAGLVQARQEEGARLARLLSTLLDEITALHAEATRHAAEQPTAHQARLQDQLAVLLRDAQHDLSEERLAQEIALLAARSDVREELDRLDSHLQAARALLVEGTAVGRRFDFLVQEFVRETNTLCAKSSSIALTATGLRLKATIEQLREQVQNVE